MKLQATITKLKVTLLVALSFFSSIGFSQNFNEYFKRGNNNNTFFNGVTNFNDSIIGVANYFDGSVDVIEIIVFSDSGKILFSKNKADNNNYNYIGTKTLKRINENLFAMAYTFDSASVGIKGKLLLYDKKKDKINTKTYFTPKKSSFEDFVFLKDSTFLLFGTSTEFDPNGDFYVAHVGKSGEFISDTTYGNTNLAERGYAITTTSDGGYAFTGSRQVAVSGQPYRSKIVVYKFDSLGTLGWTNQYGGDFYNVPYSINSLNDSLILIGGLNVLKETTPDYFLERPYSVILNLNGLIKYDYFFQLKDSFSDGFITNQTVFENQIYSVGFWYFFPFSDSIISPEFLAHPSFIVKHNQQLDEIWRRYIYKFENQDSDNSLYSIEKSSDGGFIMGGTINGKAPDPVGQYGWIVKTDSMGCVVPGCHLVGVENNKGQIANNLLVYPNPSNNTQNTWLSFNLAKTEAVTIKILSLNGQIEKAQNFGLLPQGNHQIQMDITLASGIYFIKLQTPTLNETVKWVVE